MKIGKFTLPSPFYLACGLAILLWAVQHVRHMQRSPPDSYLAAVAISALMAVWYGAWRNAQRVEERLVRLETEVRLSRLLPGRDLAALTTPQLSALKRASDHELPVLVERVLRGELSAPAEILGALGALGALGSQRPTA